MRIGSSILSVKLLTPNWAELEYGETDNMLRSTNEDMNMEWFELRNMDNFEISGNFENLN